MTVLTYRDGPGDASTRSALGAWDVLPGDLLPRIAQSGALLVQDLESFPFESLRPSDWEVPIAVVLDGSADVLELVHGEAVLDRLGPLDRVVASTDMFAPLAAKRWWPKSMHVDPGTDAVRTGRETAETLMGLRPEKSKWLRRIRELRRAMHSLGTVHAIDIGGGGERWRCWLPRSITWTDQHPEVAVVVDKASDGGDELATGWSSVGPSGTLVVLDEIGSDRLSPKQVVDAATSAADFDVQMHSIRAVSDTRGRYGSYVAVFKGFP